MQLPRQRETTTVLTLLTLALVIWLPSLESTPVMREQLLLIAPWHAARMILTGSE